MTVVERNCGATPGLETPTSGTCIREHFRPELSDGATGFAGSVTAGLAEGLFQNCGGGPACASEAAKLNPRARTVPNPTIFLEWRSVFMGQLPIVIKRDVVFCV